MFTTRPELIGTFGVVTTTHWIGSAVGMSVLEKGGNAFDAAVATGFVLQVVEPHLNGPGGDMPIIFQAANKPQPEVLCGQGTIPAAASIKTSTIGLVKPVVTPIFNLNSVLRRFTDSRTPGIN